MFLGENEANMATYKQIQDWVKLQYGFIPKTCWIADVKHQAGLPMRKAPNRKGAERVEPCPLNKIKPIQSALRHFEMIKYRS
jgi:hypothetical protein